MEGERGWDPKIKKYFLKIINSFSFGLLWMMACVMGGIYYKLGYPGNHPVVYTVLFYAGMLLTLLLLIRYLYRIWKKD